MVFKCDRCKDEGWVWCYSCGSNGMPGKMEFLECGECYNKDGKLHPELRSVYGEYR
jgi:hypothetical protein